MTAIGRGRMGHGTTLKSPSAGPRKRDGGRWEPCRGGAGRGGGAPTSQRRRDNAPAPGRGTTAAIDRRRRPAGYDQRAQAVELHIQNAAQLGHVVGASGQKAVEVIGDVGECRAGQLARPALLRAMGRTGKPASRPDTLPRTSVRALPGPSAGNKVASPVAVVGRQVAPYDEQVVGQDEARQEQPTVGGPDRPEAGMENQPLQAHSKAVINHWRRRNERCFQEFTPDPG